MSKWIWPNKQMTPLQKIMWTLGWVKRDINRTLTCAWCGKEFGWSGCADNTPPRFCTENHNRKARAARISRDAQSNKPELKRAKQVAHEERMAAAIEAKAAKKAARKAEVEEREASVEARKQAQLEQVRQAQLMLVHPVTPTPPHALAKLAPRKCECRNHMGTPKIQHPSEDAAIKQIIRRHLRHGEHGIYKCPTSDAWHVTSRPRKEEAA